jgi:solute carrier family 13 (sodium-dependent dicarboxylate transporter), member 2/3/5
MADVPCCAIFMAIALELLRKLGLPPGASRFGKAVMIGIPIASLIGGVGTPAGSSVNILGLYFVERHGHVRVPFLTWAALGLPLVAVLLPFAAWVLCRVYPPERERLTELLDGDDGERARLTAAERKALGILGLMIAFWVAGTWYPQIDIVVVGVAGAVALFLPGVRLLTWPEAERSTGWDALFMIGGVTSLGAASVDTGLAKWMVDGMLGGMQGWPVVAVLAAISAFAVVIHLVLPIAPVVNAVLIPPIVLLAAGSGHHPALYALPVAFTASCAFLLPLDAVSLVTFSKGYYRMFDMLLPGAIISLAWVLVLTALMVALGPPLGLF